MGNPGLESDSLDERMEDAPRIAAPAGTSSGSSAVAPRDGMTALLEDWSAAGSPPEIGPDVLRKDLGRSFFPPLPLYADCWTSTRCA